MSALVRRIRRLILSGGSNQELQESIEELGLTAGEPVRGSLQKLQRIILNDGRDSEVQLRRALNGIGVTGGDAGGRERARIREVILRTGRVDELREAIDTLITIEDGSPGGEAYVAPAVVFPFEAIFSRGVALDGVTDTPTGIYTGWVKTVSADNIARFVKAAAAGFELRATSHPRIELFLYDDSAASLIEAFTTTGMAAGAWRHALIAWNTNFEIGSRRLAVYLDDSPLTITFDYEEEGAFAVDVTGNDFFACTGDAPRSEPVEYADVGLWLGTTIVEADGTISEVNRRKFIDANGKPVNPSNWPANPVLKFSGDADGFTTNQGTGGAFGLTSGPLTNASTSPSE